MTARELYVVAGPNGAGKSSFVAQPHIAELLKGAPFVNPDNIAFEIDPERRNTAAVQIQAGTIALRQRQAHLASGTSFAFETTLSGHSEIKLMRQARDAGFAVTLFFIGVDDPALSRRRIEERVVQGGHSVPLDAIERRYPRTMANFAAALDLAHTVMVYDNSGMAYRPLLELEQGQVKYLAPDLPLWAVKAIPAGLLNPQDLTAERQAPAAVEPLIPGRTIAMAISETELKEQIAGSNSVEEAMQHVLRLASVVFAEPRPVVAAIQQAAIAGPIGDLQIAGDLQRAPQSFGALAGKEGILVGRAAKAARKEAVAKTKGLGIAAEGYLRTVHAVRRSLEQRRQAQAGRLAVEIHEPSQQLLNALDRGELELTADLKSELQRTRSAFERRFGHELGHLRGGEEKHMQRLAAEHGIDPKRLETARTVLLGLDKAHGRELARERAKEVSQEIGRGLVRDR